MSESGRRKTATRGPDDDTAATGSEQLPGISSNWRKGVRNPDGFFPPILKAYM